MTIEHQIASYISARYGEEKLCLFRILCGFDSFRDAAFRGNLQALLGMPFLTFEKYLREQHDIGFQNGAGRSVSLRRGTAVWRAYEDDQLSSVTGALVVALRALHPEANMLESAPVVQLVRGTSVDDVLDNFDLSRLVEEYILLPGAEQQLGADVIRDARDFHAALALDSAPKIVKYRAVELLHNLAVRARAEDLSLVEGEQLPVCPADRFMDVWMGIEDGYSLQHPTGVLSKAMVDHFMELYPDAVPAPDRRTIYRGGVEVKLSEILGLPPATCSLQLSFEDTLQTPGGGAQASAQRAPAAARPDQAPRAPFLEGGPAAEEGSPEAAGRQIRGVQAGIDHVVHYIDTDFNSLPLAEREIYAYGFPGGKRYIDGLSPKKRKDLFRHLPVGSYRDVEVITKISSALKLYVRRAELTDEQWALLAGGRLLMQKGGWDIQVDGEWTREMGPM